MELISTIIDFEPSSSHEETYQHLWWDPMVKECTSIIKNDIWDIVPRLEQRWVVAFKWLYKIKQATNDGINNFKVIFVARGFSQKGGLDFEHEFSLVTIYTSIRENIYLSSFMGWMIL